MQEKEAVMEKESIDSNGIPEKGDSGTKLQGSAENTVCVGSISLTSLRERNNFFVFHFLSSTALVVIVGELNACLFFFCV